MRLIHTIAVTPLALCGAMLLLAGGRPSRAPDAPPTATAALVRAQPGELADTEWANERGATVDVDDRSGGTIRLPNVPWRFSDSPGVAVSGVPKFRGEDNRTILADLLGYDEERLDALEADGVLSSRIPK